jgi:hypothetical protein
VFSGFEFMGVILITAIPFGIYLVEAIDNVESAEAAGDSYCSSAGSLCFYWKRGNTRGHAGLEKRAA